MLDLVLPSTSSVGAMLRYCTCSAMLCTLVPGSVAFSPNAKLLQLRSTHISPRTACTLHASADHKDSHHTPEKASEIARERREKVSICIYLGCSTSRPCADLSDTRSIAKSRCLLCTGISIKASRRVLFMDAKLRRSR
jgi:hypothetical protein